MASKSLLKTNVALTTNIKLVVSSDYKLYLESIDSHPQLSDTRYKHYLINKDVFLDEVIPVFYKDTPPDIAFTILNKNDKDKVGQDYKDQYDFSYNCGSNYISDTFYNEEFEYFAPLYLDGSLPENFIIFRIDGPGLIDVNSSNFRSEIVEKLKCVSYFDLNTSVLGEFLQKNITNNASFPKTPLEIDVRKYEFSNWNGINYETGGYTSKSLFIEDFLEKETTYHSMDKFFTDGWKNNKVVFPNILNLNFLFDDTPATKDKLRKWSLNRYCGFYIDKKYTSIKVTPYQPSKLISNLKIIADNIIVNTSNNSVDPIDKGWKNEFYYVEYLGDFYKLVKYQDINNTTVYKIISDLDLSGKELLLNKNIISIDSNNYLSYNTDYNLNTFTIPNFDDWDLCLININSKWHVVKKDITGFRIQSDYTFEVTYDNLIYYVNRNDPSYTTTIKLNDVDDSNKPLVFDIFFCQFTDIHDIDNNIVDTQYAKYEYSKATTLSRTEESKLYREYYQTRIAPHEMDTYIYNNEYVNIPVSSEYVATSELFEVVDNTLTSLWNKNPDFVKWGYKNSLSTFDYSYRFNNSFKSEDYNRDVNTDLVLPNRFERNLDYFYTINSATNGSLVEYNFQSLNINITDSNKTIVTTTFDFPTYTGTTSNYFNYIFSKSDYLENGNIFYNTKKYSTFNTGDKNITNSTVFRGLKYSIYDVKKVYIENGELSSFSLKPSEVFNDYDFSVILTSNNTYDNKWNIIDIFELDRFYKSNSLVVYNNIIYKCINDNTISNPLINPANSSDWAYSLDNDILYNPTVTYNQGDYIYNDNDFWMSANALLNSNTTLCNLWLNNTSYGYEDCILYKHNLYVSITSSNTNKAPTNTSYWKKVEDYQLYTTYNQGDYVRYQAGSALTTAEYIYKSNGNNNLGSAPPSGWTQLKELKWKLVPYWDVTKTYNNNDLIQYDGTIYKKVGSGNGPLTNITYWTILYSINPSNRLYGNTKSTNDIIFMNNRYYKYLDSTQMKLDNGIIIYIHKKWKNILINISINDGTVPYTYESIRELMYSDINMKLTSKNFMDSINDISNKYGFLNNLKYIIIENDGTSKTYDITNISEIPYIINCDKPDTFQTKFNSYKLKDNTIDSSIYNVKNKLTDRIIPNINSINYYDGTPLGVEIIPNKDENDSTIDSYSGIKNINSISLYRFNGFYAPILSKIDLFKSPDVTNDGVNNKKFDETLTNFGLSRQLIFSKVNPKESPLKLIKYKNVKSIYPMIDEFGYSYKDFFIFKSNWDLSYYTLTK